MRVYPAESGNPVIGCVLSPDIAVQDPGYTQSYNRYSYCMNNPLRYTNPSGWLVEYCEGDYKITGVDINLFWNQMVSVVMNDRVGGGGRFEGLIVKLPK
jgi:hypothetical protein